jgi:hypothetical protein
MPDTDCRQQLRIEISGFISEVVCGQIPLSCKAAFARHLIANRDADGIPAWQLKRNPFYVSPEQIERLWYDDDETMRQLMKPWMKWRTHREINGFCDLLGFGSGREGVGIFGLAVVADSGPVIEFVPFEPGPESQDLLRNMNHIRLRHLDPVPPPSPNAGHVAVSGGSWGKGVMRFSTDMVDEFDEAGLELLVTDLTPLGIGEEHFVSGITYAGRRLKGEIVRQGKKEWYPVLWHDPEEDRWRQMCEPGHSDPNL